MAVLGEHEWHGLSEAHRQRVNRWIAPRLERMSRQERHPVDDFLFEYYSYRPGQLARWHPGFGITLTGESAAEYLEHKYYTKTPDGVTADITALLPVRRNFLSWLRDMLEATWNRPAVFGCFGLHEWAMVYRSPEIRHERYPLRLSPGELEAVVESLPLRCTHYDAFRFFTAEARPLNRHQLTREGSPEFEQGGCLHANMDLYKWAYKLAPFSSSELVADAFELAREIRQLDMEASPYDLRSLGYEPVLLETPEGRAVYEERQRGFAQRAEPLRTRLTALCEELLAAGRRLEVA